MVNAAKLQRLCLGAQQQREIVLARGKVLLGLAVEVDPLPLLPGGHVRRLPFKATDARPRWLAGLDAGAENADAIGGRRATDVDTSPGCARLSSAARSWAG